MTHPIEKWFTGKALTVVREYVLPTLAEAETLSYWPKGASRKVTAALNKCNVAHKFARANERDLNDRRTNHAGLLDDVKDIRGERSYEAKLRGWGLTHAMRFGCTSHAPDCLGLADKLVPYCVNDAERAALATARSWAADFAPVAELIDRLDATRPKPVLILKTLSPTVLGNVGAAMGLKLDTIKPPEMEWIKVEKLDKKGDRYWTWEVNILWPEGTKFNTSRYATGDHCHACGHCIKNPFNWCPLVAESPDGPKALWVGRDCAKNLFGCDVSVSEVEWRKDLATARE